VEILDKVLEVVFARYRRRLGDGEVDAAWRSASNTVVAYASWAVVAAACLGLILISSLLRLSILQKRSFQVVAVIAGLTAAFMLERRFRKYLLAPNTLVPAESPADTRLVREFRLLSFGFFGATCLIGFLLHRVGVNFV
jgi:hypothetical protein